MGSSYVHSIVLPRYSQLLVMCHGGLCHDMNVCHDMKLDLCYLAKDEKR